MASRASLSGVVRKIEQETDSEYSDEELREMQSVDDEVNFQVALYELLEKSSRSEDLVKKLKVLAFNNGVSNIGIAVEKE